MGESVNPVILLVEDDVELSGLIAEYLGSKGYTVMVEQDGRLAVERIVQEQPDLVILDLMLPGKDGISICREARHAFDNPVLMLTASNDDVDQILGLEIGADDFVRKPVEPRILLARIRALLRRSEQTAPAQAVSVSASAPVDEGKIVVEGLVINLMTRSVMLNGAELELSTPEFDVLSYLAENAGKVVSRDELFQQLRNFEYDGQSRFVDITISYIRKKLGADAERFLKTVRGKGYLFLGKGD